MVQTFVPGVSVSHEPSMLGNTVFDGIEACGAVTDKEESGTQD